MKHHIICRFIPKADKEKIASEAKALFSELVGQNGIHAVEVKQNCVNRENRFDLMIIIDMEKASLEFYDSSSQHKKWKTDYCCYVAEKVIFDSEF